MTTGSHLLSRASAAALIPTFGQYKLTELKPSIIKDWYSKLNISAKRINNVLIPLRQAYRMAYEDEIVDSNPMSRIRSLPLEPREPAPFTLDEIQKILSQLEGQERNLIQFGFWSGLRTSELIELKWSDIDFKNNRFYVRRAKVSGQIKTPKTSSGFRSVELNQHSKSALLNQKKHSFKNPYVFLDPQTGEPWVSDSPIRKKVWINALKKAGIRYRVPYQMRHSFASQMLTEGRDPSWLSAQMGHKDWGMIRKTYARWIIQ